MNRKHTLLAALLSAILTICFVPLPVQAQSTRPELPPGTRVRVRMIDSLDSAQSHVGDIFHATLEEPTMVNGKQLYDKGADVTGTVVAVHPSGRLTDPGELNLMLNTVIAPGGAASLAVTPLVIKGESHGKSNATKVGGGAVVGALIGAIAGGGKGAAIGAGAGAAAGTGAAAATGKREAKVESEAVLTFVTTDAASARAAAANAGAIGGSADSTASSTDRNASTASTASRSGASAGGSSSSGSSSSAAAEGNSADSRDADSATDASQPRPSDAVLFTARDRRVIRNCLNEHASELPTGTTEGQELPPGSDRQIRLGARLSDDLQSKVQPMPLVCENELPRLPKDQERVVYSGRVLLLDGSGHILDMFKLNGGE